MAVFSLQTHVVFRISRKAWIANLHRKGKIKGSGLVSRVFNNYFQIIFLQVTWISGILVLPLGLSLIKYLKTFALLDNWFRVMT